MTPARGAWPIGRKNLGVLADRENGEKIIAHVKRLSGAFGTQIEYKDGIGVIAIK
jgi:hypothetical protein